MKVSCSRFLSVTGHIFCRIARKIIDAIFGLSFDDTPSNLAAAALFYLLTSDVSDFNYTICHTLYLFLLYFLSFLFSFFFIIIS